MNFHASARILSPRALIFLYEVERIFLLQLQGTIGIPTTFSTRDLLNRVKLYGFGSKVAQTAHFLSGRVIF